MRKRTWLIAKRKAKGLKQYELANRLGISSKTVSNIERGYRNPGGHLAYKLSKELDFDMRLLYDENTKKEREKVEG